MKKILTFVLLFLAIGISHAQNPTIINTATNQGVSQYPASAHTGRVTLGLSTNGAVNGYVLGWNTNVWSLRAQTGGSGGGGDVFTTSNNTFSANNTFNGSLTSSNLTVNGRINVTGLNLTNSIYGPTIFGTNGVFVTTTTPPLAVLSPTSPAATGNSVGAFEIMISSAPLSRIIFGIDTTLASGGTGWIQSQLVGTAAKPLLLNPKSTGSSSNGSGGVGVGRATDPRALFDVDGTMIVSGVTTNQSTLVVQGALIATSTFNQVPLSWGIPITTIGGNSNWVTFVHEKVPSGKTTTITRLRVLNDAGASPETNQIVRIFNATTAATLLSTNANWDGSITFTNLTRWYARFENNASATNAVNVSCSIQGTEQ